MTSFSCRVFGHKSLLADCRNAWLERGHESRAVVTRNRDILDWAAVKSLPIIKNIAALEGQFKVGDFDWLFSIANFGLIPVEVPVRPTQGARNFRDGPLPHPR